MSYASEVLADSPLLYCKFDEAAGQDQLFDSSGNGYDSNDGQSFPPAFEQTSLVTGGTYSADFDGSNSERIGWSDAAWMDVTDLTMEAWIKPGTVGTGDLQFICNRWNATDSDRHYRMEIYEDAGSVYARAFVRIGGVSERVDSTTALSSGSTYHIVVTADTTANTLKLYVNGVEEDSEATSGSIATGNEALLVGCEVSGSNLRNFFDGQIDELAIYGTALSSTRVTAHYNAGAGASTAAVDLPSPTASATATYLEPGVGSVTLPTPSASAIGTVSAGGSITGTGTPILPLLTVAATGTHVSYTTGTATVTLPLVQAVAAGGANGHPAPRAGRRGRRGDHRRIRLGHPAEHHRRRGRHRT